MSLNVGNNKEPKKSADKNASASRKKWTPIRRAVQAALLILFLIPVVVSGWSLLGLNLYGEALTEQGATPAQLPFYGTLSSSSFGPINLMDPYAFLQTVCAAKTIDVSWILAALVPLLIFGLIRGRAFCGWVCPVNLVLEGVDFLRKKFLKKKLPEKVVPRQAKIWIALAVLVLSAIFSIPVFETMNPISFINKGLVFGSMVGGLTLLAIILMELFWGHRVWCRSLCPIGGFYQLLGKVGLVKVAIDHSKCINCTKCQKACLSDPEILEPAIYGDTDYVCAGDCMICGKCIEACPSMALAMKIAAPTADQLKPRLRSDVYESVDEADEAEAKNEAA